MSKGKKKNGFKGHKSVKQNGGKIADPL